MNNEIMEVNALEAMSQIADFEVSPCDMAYDFDDKSRFQKLSVTSGQKMQISALMHQLPTAASSVAIAQAYIAKFPKGLPHTLTALKQGGYGSMICVNGKFAGSASFYNMTAHATALGAFTAMSAITGQYFLAEINTRMDKLSQKLDKILEFLYSDKKAELMSELSFTKYAHQNYSSIVGHEQQRLATLVSLQKAQKVAMKDIEFYMDDLDSKVNQETKKFTELEVSSAEAFRIRNCLELSLQVYVTASLLEVYYAENYDTAYLENVEDAVGCYINRCEKRMIGAFNRLSSKVSTYKASPLEKIDKSPLSIQIDHFLESRDTGEESPMRAVLHSVLSASTKKAEYYLTATGDVYAKVI